MRHEAYVVDFVPAAEDEMRNRIDRYHGSVCQYRLCEACWTWARATLDDDSAVTALGSRADEAEPGRWLLGHRFNVAAAGLLACDVSLLERTVGAAGRRTKVLGRAEAKGYRPPQGELMFVGTTGADQATQVVSRLAPDARERTVVVARFDATDDLGGALRAGALDFLVSPLTPQQVAGAFERHAQGPSELARDVTTGLPRRRSPGGRFGHPGHVLRLSRVPQSELLGTAWLLRRFLRGYDDVGLHDERTLEAVVYCPDAAAQAVASRLMAILSPGITVTVVERLAVQAQGGRLRRAA